MPRVTFLQDGRWADEPHSHLPQFDVLAGEEKDVSEHVAKHAIAAGVAELCGPKPKAEAPPTPAQVKATEDGDTPKAEKTKAKKAKKAAEKK